MSLTHPVSYNADCWHPAFKINYQCRCSDFRKIKIDTGFMHFRLILKTDKYIKIQSFINIGKIRELSDLSEYGKEVYQTKFNV